MTAEGLPPHDFVAEGAVLRACMVDDGAFDKCADLLQAEAFFSEAHRRIYEAIVALRLQQMPTDIASVLSRLRDTGRMQQIGGPAYLTQVATDSPAIANVRYHATSLVGLWKSRMVILEAQRTVAQGLTSLGDPTAFVARAAEAMHAIAYSSATTTIEPVTKALAERFGALVNAEAAGGTVGVPSGFYALDRLTGGMHRGDLTILAARPSVGKSALALAMADNVADAGHAVAFFSLEMVRSQLVDRLLGMSASVDVSRLRTGAMTQTEWTVLTREAQRIHKLPLWIDDRPGITVLEVAAKSRRVQAEEARNGRRLGLIVVDYLQLMRATDHARKMNSREREVSETAEYLKGIAVSLDVPVLALSQLNRQSEQGEGRKPRLSDLRESGALEQHANNVIFIHRERDKDHEGVELIVAKQRNGPTGSAVVRFNARFTRFENIDNGDAAYDAAQ